MYAGVTCTPAGCFWSSFM